MASLADLASVFDQQDPAGFTLARLGLQSDFTDEQTKVGAQRLGRNFSQRYLPDLISGQAARGAWNSSATLDKSTRLIENTGDRLQDLVATGAQAQAGMAANALLAQTGVRL